MLSENDSLVTSFRGSCTRGKGTCGRVMQGGHLTWERRGGALRLPGMDGMRRSREEPVTGPARAGSAQSSSSPAAGSSLTTRQPGSEGYLHGD